jgi:hypothetical protein
MGNARRTFRVCDSLIGFQKAGLHEAGEAPSALNLGESHNRLGNCQLSSNGRSDDIMQTIIDQRSGGTSTNHEASRFPILLCASASALITKSYLA